MIITLSMAALVCLTALAGGAAHAAEADVRRVWQILDYLAVDYSGAVQDGKVAAVGRFDGAGVEEIDAKGLAVTPGFVDIHTHYDAQVLWDPMLTISPWHGVTTVVVGNCGFGIAPTRPEHRGLIGLARADVTHRERHRVLELDQRGASGLRRRGLLRSHRPAFRMGGQIGVSSVPGEGSTFSFTVTLGIDESVVQEHSDVDIAGRRALVVDDSATARAALALC